MKMGRMMAGGVAGLVLLAALSGAAVAAGTNDENTQVAATDNGSSAQVSYDTMAAPAAGGGAPAPSKWRFSITPLSIWGFNIEGPMSIKGHSTDVNASFGDIKDKVDGGGGVGFEFGKGSWSGFVSGGIIKFLQGDVTTPVAPGVHSDVTLDWTSGELGVAYRLPLSPAKKAPKVELLGGARYNNLKLEIRATSGASFDAERHQSWTDPFFGMRLAQPIGGNFAFITRADVGGFGISNNQSKLNWNFTSGVAYQWRFKSDWGIALFGGYKLNELDYRNEDPTKLQVIQRFQGPAASLSFNF